MMPGPFVREAYPKGIWLKLMPLVAGSAIALALPFFVNPGITFLAGLVWIEVVVALAFNLLFTAAGLMSFGQAMFVAAGAYTAGLIGLHLPGVPFVAAMLASALAGGLVALGVGLLALRRPEGVTFAMLTLTAAELLHIVILKTTFLGRNDGVTNIPRPPLLPGVAIASNMAFYVLIVVTCTLLSLVLWWCTHSRWGQALQAVRMDPDRAAFLSMNVNRYRLGAFLVSGATTAMAASLHGPWSQILSPELAYWPQSTVPLLDTLLGGAGSFWGPALGAVVFAVIGYQTRSVAGISDLVTGGLLLAVVLAIPGGLMGLGTLATRLSRRRAHPVRSMQSAP